MENLKNKSIILVGGAGFIGHHLAIRLKSLGARVTVLDSLMVNNYYHYLKLKHKPGVDLYIKMIEQRLQLLKKNGIEVIEVDVRDYKFTNYLLCKIPCETVVHLAAVAHADKSNKDPYSTFDHSLRTLENTLDTARTSHNDINHFIYLSSSMIYGNFTHGEVTEETKCDPLGIYGNLKFCAEQIVKAYQQAFGLNYTIIRPSALYGERCVSRRVGQIFIEEALKGNPINITGDGSSSLDFTYVDDFVSGIVNVITNKASKNQTFNLTYGEARTIGQMADIIKHYFKDIRINYISKDKLTPDRGTLDVQKAKNLIGYSPQYPLEKGYPKYIEWYLEEWKKIFS